MRTEEREEHASLYALGLLEGSELAAFEREMAADPTLGALVTELENAANCIALSAPPPPVPSAVRSRIFQEIDTLRKSEEPAPIAGRSFGWVPWTLAAGFAIFAGFTWNEKSKISAAAMELAERDRTSEARLTSLSAENRELSASIHSLNVVKKILEDRVAALETERDHLSTRLAALEAEKNQLALRIASLEARNPLDEIKAITFAPQPEAPKGATVVALWDARRQAGVLDLSKLPAPAAGKDYQLWILSPDSPAPISAGLVSPASGQAPFQSPRPLTQVAALAISLEPKGGSESPRGPVIYVGKF